MYLRSWGASFVGSDRNEIRPVSGVKITPSCLNYNKIRTRVQEPNSSPVTVHMSPRELQSKTPTPLLLQCGPRDRWSKLQEPIPTTDKIQCQYQIPFLSLSLSSIMDSFLLSSTQASLCFGSTHSRGSDRPSNACALRSSLGFLRFGSRYISLVLELLVFTQFLKFLAVILDRIWLNL